MRLSSLFLFIFLVSFTSCEFFGGELVSGNGNVIIKGQSTGSFNSVHVHGAIDLKIKQDATNSVRIEADENLMQYLEVCNEGSTLVVRPKDGYNLDPSKEIVVYASAPVFQELKISGSGDMMSENLINGSQDLSLEVSGSGSINMDVETTKLTSDISGSGSMALRGKASQFSASISGSGSIKCFDLNTDNSEVDLSGSADAQVTANQKLNISISGSGEVQYRGNASVQQDVSGSGKVQKVG